jgi:hypothetical protein
MLPSFCGRQILPSRISVREVRSYRMCGQGAKASVRPSSRPLTPSPSPRGGEGDELAGANRAHRKRSGLYLAPTERSAERPGEGRATRGARSTPPQLGGFLPAALQAKLASVIRLRPLSQPCHRRGEGEEWLARPEHPEYAAVSTSPPLRGSRNPTRFSRYPR